MHHISPIWASTRVTKESINRILIELQGRTTVCWSTGVLPMDGIPVFIGRQAWLELSVRYTQYPALTFMTERDAIDDQNEVDQTTFIDACRRYTCGDGELYTVLKRYIGGSTWREIQWNVPGEQLDAVLKNYVGIYGRELEFDDERQIPCPFCGGLIVQFKDEKTSCLRCYAHGPDGGIVVWNRRAYDRL